jgi:hypothetical protein
MDFNADVPVTLVKADNIEQEYKCCGYQPNNMHRQVMFLQY